MLDPSRYDFALEPGDAASCTIGGSALGTRIKQDDDWDVLILSNSVPYSLKPSEHYFFSLINGPKENVLVDTFRYSLDSVIDMITTKKYFDLFMDPGCQQTCMHLLVFVLQYSGVTWHDPEQKVLFQSRIQDASTSYFWHYVVWHLQNRLKHIDIDQDPAEKSYHDMKVLFMYVPLLKNYFEHGIPQLPSADRELAREFKRHVLRRYPYFQFTNRPLEIDKFYLNHLENYITQQLNLLEPPNYIQLP